MNKIAAIFLIFAQLAHAGNYPIPAPGANGNVLQSNGSKWTSATSAGGGLKNYVTYNNYEINATTGWTASGCATVTSGIPNCAGSGAAAFSSSNGGRTKGANTSSPALDSSSSIQGTYALNLATTGAGTIGDGYVTSAYSLEPEDRGVKPLYYSVSYKVASGTPVGGGTSSDTYALAAYDPANNTFIVPSNPFCFTKTSGQGQCQGLINTQTTTTSIQLFVYSPIAPTGASSLLLDDWLLTPNLLPTGPPVTNTSSALSITPVNFGTVSNTDYRSYRIGDRWYFRGTFKSGTTAASVASFTLPSVIAIDSSKIHSTADQHVGEWRQIGTAAGPTTQLAASSGPVFYDGSTTGSLYMAYQFGGNVFVKANANALLNTNDSISIQFDIPVSGYDSNMGLASSTNNGTTTSTVTTSSHTGGFSANTTGTYNPPAGSVQIKFCGVGGGAGGGASGTTSGTAGTDGTATTFGTSVISLPGGSHGLHNGDGGAGGGAPTINSPAVAGIIGLGAQGGSGGNQGASPVTAISGGMGGSSALGGAGADGSGGGGATLAGLNAAANTGSGGGGAGAGTTTNVTTGSGGGSGTYACATIKAPFASGGYSYTVGAKGTGQGLGTSGAKGGDGADGQIVIEESYLPNPTVGLDQDNYTSQSANYTLSATDRTVNFTASATATLLAAAQIRGRKVDIISGGSSVDVTITPPSGTICGQSSIKLGGGESIGIQSDGTNYIGLNGGCLAHRSAKLVCSSSSSITAQLGGGGSASDWITAVGNIASGGCAVTMATGFWSIAPHCSMNATGSGTIMFHDSAPSTTNLQPRGFTDTGANATSHTCEYVCDGAR